MPSYPAFLLFDNFGLSSCGLPHILFAYPLCGYGQIDGWLFLAPYIVIILPLGRLLPSAHTVQRPCGIGPHGRPAMPTSRVHLLAESSAGFIRIVTSDTSTGIRRKSQGKGSRVIVECGEE